MEWACRFGDVADQRPTDFDGDAAGYQVLSSRVNGSVETGGTAPATVGSETSTDALLMRLDGDGAQWWARRPAEGGQQGLEHGALAVALGSTEVVVAGQFQGRGEFGSGNIDAMSIGDMFVAVYERSGFLRRVRVYQATNSINPQAVAVDAAGAIYITGSFEGMVDFGGGPYTSFTGTSRADIFVVKFDASGNHEWSHRWGDGFPQTGLSIAVHPTTGVVLTGWMEGTAEPGTGLIGHASGNRTVLLVRMDLDGVVQWGKAFGDDATGTRAGRAVAIDDAGDIWVAGAAEGNVDFGDGAAGGGADAFIARFSVDGNALCHHRFALGGSSVFNDLELLPTGGAVAGGAVEGAAAATTQAVIARVDSACAAAWERVLGPTGASVNATGIVSDGTSLWVGGFFTTAGVVLDGVTLPHAGGEDIWLARFRL